MPSLKFEPVVICPDAPSPAAVEKIEQASSAKFFSGTARRRGQMRLRLPLERICAQYGFGFFAPEKSKSVSSTAKRQGGLSRGKLGPPCPCFAYFCTNKSRPSPGRRANKAFSKGPATPTGDCKLSPTGQAYRLCLCKRPRPAARRPPAWPKNLLSAFLGGKAAPRRARMARKKRFRLVNLPVLRYDKGSTPS